MPASEGENNKQPRGNKGRGLSPAKKEKAGSGAARRTSEQLDKLKSGALSVGSAETDQLACRVINRRRSSTQHLICLQRAFARRGTAFLSEAS